MNYKAVIQYEGTRYRGWQVQGNTDQTIQGKLETLLGRMAGEPVEVHGSGRTDGGSACRRAGDQFSLQGQHESAGDPRLYEPVSAEDIAVLSVEEAAPRFFTPG